MKNLFNIEINSNRIFGLDILRAAAIMYVMIGHATNFLPKKLALWCSKILYDGVGIFFVLSGFLIGGILIKQLETNKLNKRLLIVFWIRRWFRTLPNYYLILIIIFFLNLIFNKNFDYIYSLRYFVFIQNIFDSPSTFFRESWSLSIEEWFYIITPISISLCIKFLKLSVKNSVMLVILFVIVVITIYRYVFFLNLNDYTYENFINVRYSVIGRLDSLMYGVLGAYVHFYKKDFWINYRKIFFYIGLVLFLPYLLIPFEANFLFTIVFSFTTTSLSILFILPFFNGLKSGKGFLYKLITRISLISYSLYLINMQVSIFLEKCIDWDKIIFLYYTYIYDKFAWTIVLFLCYFLFWFLSISISILLYKYFEVPMTKLRDLKILNDITKKIT